MVWFAIIISCVSAVFLAILGALCLEAVETEVLRREKKLINDVDNKLWMLRVQLNETRNKAGLKAIQEMRPLPDEDGWTVEDQQEFIRKMVEGRS